MDDQHDEDDDDILHDVDDEDLEGLDIFRGEATTMDVASPDGTRIVKVESSGRVEPVSDMTDGEWMMIVNALAEMAAQNEDDNVVQIFEKMGWHRVKSSLN